MKIVLKLFKNFLLTNDLRVLINESINESHYSIC